MKSCYFHADFVKKALPKVLSNIYGYLLRKKDTNFQVVFDYICTARTLSSRRRSNEMEFLPEVSVNPISILILLKSFQYLTKSLAKQDFTLFKHV